MKNRGKGLAAAVLGIVLLAGGCSGSDSGNGGGAAGSKGMKRPSAGGGAQSQQGAGHDRADRRPAAPSGHLSTFALDVDTASYDFARRALLEGRSPDPATVRPEEFVNHFEQGYREPPGNGFSIAADGGRISSAGDAGEGGESADGDVRLLRVGLATRRAAGGARRDANLTFVIDVSGSMGEPGRLDLVKSSMHTLVDQLRPSDSVAIVAYDDRARLVREMTPASRRSELHRAIDSLETGDSTNLEAGMTLGYKEARRAFRPGATNRVIVSSDGLANTGATSSAAILRRVAEEAGTGISLLCVGVGSQYGDRLMEELADHGNGRAVYVSEPSKARRLFVAQLPATVELRARDAKAQVGFDPRRVESFRLIGYDDRGLRAQDFRDDSVDGGEIGPGHKVTALYAIRLRPGAAGHVADVTVRWQDPGTGEPAERDRAVTVDDLSPRLWEEGAPRLRAAVATAYFAEHLRDGDPGHGPRSPYVSPSQGPFVTHGRLPGEPVMGLDELSRRVTALPTETEDMDVGELAGLIRRAQHALRD